LYRVHLTEAQRQEFRQLSHAPGLAPRTRERLEMIRLSDAGWSVPRIAQLLEAHPQTVRHWLKRFLVHSFAGLPDQPHLGQQSALTPEILEALRQELAPGNRTWTASQITDWLAEHHGIHRSVDQIRRLLKRVGLSYKRTYRSLRHKQDAAQVAEKQAELAALEKGAIVVA
jgi:transposase